MITNIKYIFTLVLIVSATSVFAADTPVEATTTTTTDQEQQATPKQPGDPVVMLKQITNEVLSALKANSATIKNNNKKLYEVVDAYILPHVDFDEMARWVAGKSAWSKASEQSKKAFVQEFQVLVVRTYATALLSYTNETVDFTNQKLDTSKDRIQVSSRIVRLNKEDVRVDYRLIKHDGEWKVYDVIIEGVSILQGFQAQFSDKIRQEGLQKVITQIQEHNNKKKAA